MALPLQVRLQAGHLINKTFYSGFSGGGITFPVIRGGFGRMSVSLRVYCLFVLKSLIDCLTWLTVIPISNSPCYDTPRQFYQVWKISQGNSTMQREFYQGLSFAILLYWWINNHSSTLMKLPLNNRSSSLFLNQSLHNKLLRNGGHSRNDAAWMYECNLHNSVKCFKEETECYNSVLQERSELKQSVL